MPHQRPVHTCTRARHSSKQQESSPAGRNAGEVEVIEFPPRSCHLLATCARLLEAAWAGKGSERGSGLLLLAQERSQQLQSCCEVTPGYARVPAGRDRFGPGGVAAPAMACAQGEQHQNRLPVPRPLPIRPRGSRGRGVLPICTLSSCAPAVQLRVLGEGWILESMDGLPWSLTSLPRCCGPAETGSEGAREEAAGAVDWHLAPHLQGAHLPWLPQLWGSH